VLALTPAGRTLVLACYEERTKEIGQLVGRWHSMLGRYFDICDVDRTLLETKYTQDYVRVVTACTKQRK